MNTKMFLLVLVLVLTDLISADCRATTPKLKEGKQSVDQEVFIQSVRIGDYDQAKKLIQEGAEINAQSNDGFTALMFASQYGPPVHS